MILKIYVWYCRSRTVKNCRNVTNYMYSCTSRLYVYGRTLAHHLPTCNTKFSIIGSSYMYMYLGMVIVVL